MDVVNFSRRNGLVEQFKEMADSCMAEYDLDGWKDSTWTFDD
jgi:hypothetical protein